MAQAFLPDRSGPPRYAPLHRGRLVAVGFHLTEVRQASMVVGIGRTLWVQLLPLHRALEEG